MKKTFIHFFSIFLFITASAQSLYFPPLSGNTWDTISPQTFNWCQEKIDSLYNFLDTNNTKAFILLKDGKIVLEKYFGTHTESSVWYWASAGKTITAFMTGIAQQENFLSISDTTSHYLGQGWTNCTPQQEEKITIRHQLTMTSGLDDAVADPYCTLDTCLLFMADAGTRWAYHNAPYTLLDGVIENATGTSLNTYTTQKLKNPTGMTGAFYTVDYNNVFFSNARSMARFGLLILNRGNWDGTQIMTDTAYFNQMVSTSQSINESYGYLWWLNGKSTFMVPDLQLVFPGFLCPHAPADMIAAMGKDGQFLNVVPGQNLIWLRMGESPDNLPVPFLLNDKIWEYINDLGCDTTNITEHLNNTVQFFPNPVSDVLNISSATPVSKVEIYNLQGQVVKTLCLENTETQIPVSELPGGTYFVKVFSGTSIFWRNQFLKF